MNQQPKKPIPLEYARPRTGNLPASQSPQQMGTSNPLASDEDLKEPVEILRSDASGDISFVVRELRANGLKVLIEALPASKDSPPGVRLIFVESEHRERAAQLAGKILTRRARIKKLPRQKVRGIDQEIRKHKRW
jgi:hypothetical protein